MVKNLPANKETWVRPLGWEAPLEEGTATHSGTLAWRIPWTEEPGGLQSMRCRESERAKMAQHTHTRVLLTPCCHSQGSGTVYQEAGHEPTHGRAYSQ